MAPIYIDYIVPSVIMMTAGYGAASTAVRVATDSSEGVIDQFRTMAISRGSVPAGRVRPHRPDAVRSRRLRPLSAIHPGH